MCGNLYMNFCTFESKTEFHNHKVDDFLAYNNSQLIYVCIYKLCTIITINLCICVYFYIYVYVSKFICLIYAVNKSEFYSGRQWAAYFRTVAHFRSESVRWNSSVEFGTSSLGLIHSISSNVICICISTAITLLALSSKWHHSA